MDTENSKSDIVDEKKAVDNNLDIPEQASEESENHADQADHVDQEDQEDVITFNQDSLGDQSDSDNQQSIKEAPKWVKTLRDQNRKILKENKKLRKTLEEKDSLNSQKNLVRPKLSDYDWDDDLYEKALDDYEKKKFESAAPKIDDQTQQLYQKKLDSYVKRKSELKVNDFAEAEKDVINNLTLDQQNLILLNSDKPELVVYMIGKHPDILDELSEINDPAKFCYKIAKIESKTQMSKKTTKPSVAPEKKITGTSASQGISSNNLDKLLENALKTGNLTEYRRAKKQMNK